MMNEEIVIGGKYKHFKGKHYEVLNIAQHSETEEYMVVYKKLYDDYSIWVRPLNMFIGYKEINGEKIKRFELVEKP